MSFEYVSVEDAIASDGLRMVVVPQVPSPWGESAKGIFHIKNIPFKAVRLVYDNEALTKWAGQLTGPVVIRDDEAPRSSWADILFLAERLAPERSLLPEDAADRVLVLGLAHELLGEDGLAWSRRLHAVHLGLTEGGGYGPKISKYLGNKYGYRPEAGAKSGQRVIALLKMLSARLHAQRTAGSDYLVGEDLTAADIYAACVMALFAPLPQAQCAMRASTRAVFESFDEPTRAAFDPILLAHRDRMFERHLELPLQL